MFDAFAGADVSLTRIRRSTLAHNALALYAIQIASYAFSFAVVPYLARVLGPFNWGLLSLAQAIGLYLSMVVDFGFRLSATRSVARIRDDCDQLERILAGVMGAKVFLAAVCLLTVFALRYFVRPFQQYPVLFWVGALSGIGQGFSMLWFYQGLERMRQSSFMDVCGKALAAIGVFVFVHHQQDAWRVVALQCVSNYGVALILLAIAYRGIRFRRPTIRSTWQALRESAAMFLFLGAVSLYTTANTLILGMFAGPLAVSFYSGPERLVRAILGLLSPVSQSLYPRLSRLMTTDAKKAIWLARISLGIMTMSGLVLCVGTFLAAPLILRTALGPGYEPAIPAMRILCLLVPLTGVNIVLGSQWMLPLGMDATFNKIIVLAGLFNVGLAVWWAPRWQHLGMACAAVLTESVVAVAMYTVLKVRKLSPLSGGTVTLRTMLERTTRNTGLRTTTGGSTCPIT